MTRIGHVRLSAEARVTGVMVAGDAAPGAGRVAVTISDGPRSWIVEFEAAGAAVALLGEAAMGILDLQADLRPAPPPIDIGALLALRAGGQR